MGMMVLSGHKLALNLNLTATGLRHFRRYASFARRLGGGPASQELKS